MTKAELVFAIFGLFSQAMLLVFFVSRRWAPRVAASYGWLVYAFAALGLPLGIWLQIDGQSWRLFVGPILMAIWALFGSLVDLWRPSQWRRPPFTWVVLIPYVLLYFFAQMFMWWPLLDIKFVIWFVFLALFVPSTILNIIGHLKDRPGG